MTTPRFLSVVSVAMLAGTVAAGGLPDAAFGAWSRQESTGSTLVLPDPSCAQLESGKVVCAARNARNTLVVNEFASGVWRGWQTIAGGPVASSPSCVGTGDHSVICTVRGPTGALVATIFNGTKWGPLNTVGGEIFSDPSCARLSAGSVACVVRSSTGAPTATTFNGTTWGRFHALSAKGTMISGPNCASDAAGHVVCAWISIEASDQLQGVYVAEFGGGTWSKVINLDPTGTSNSGFLFNDPVCAPLGSKGSVECVAVQGWSTSQLDSNIFIGGSWVPGHWQGWKTAGGGHETLKPACGVVGIGIITCVANGGDGQLWANEFDSNGWGTWTKIGGAFFGAPTCSPIVSGRVLCVVISTGNEALSTEGP